MTTETERAFIDLISDDRKFIENLFVVENKARERIPFKYNAIQNAAYDSATNFDITVKPSQVGFSTEIIARRQKSALTVPGTNVVLIAYEDFITERLLSKVTFNYNHLRSLGIPGFPEIHHDSTYEKTFIFKNPDTHEETKSSIYIASARSFVAGRAETIHHLICDEFAFWPTIATERILAPAMARIPPGGTCDILSTPNGEDNDFCGMFRLAKEGNSVFKPHFYPWFMHEEYTFGIHDIRAGYVKDGDKPIFDLTEDEARLVMNFSLTHDQIRWRRFTVFQNESLRRNGNTRTLFSQEFPEDDVSCFLATGDMYYDTTLVDELAKQCYPAPSNRMGLHIWVEPVEGEQYMVCIDPGQAKITQTAIGVITIRKDEHDNPYPVWCARDSGWYLPELGMDKAEDIAKYYNNAEIAWEANSHGLAYAPLAQRYKNVYYRQDVVSGRTTTVPGWLTTGGRTGTKDYMFHKIHKSLHTLDCHDIELISQFRNIRVAADKVISVGADDIHDCYAIGLVCRDPFPIRRGFGGSSGFKWR
ncbi:hypothetical protein LCGC14_0316950 [marine sediment metagenome]|uniref:Terminase large subunit gp17-like C-terminal domain-containing protein n=1 Tax=marine sediment metagenome TaxID=412755 RepID=A0A0F9WSL0_9ZZZZ